MVTLAEEVVQVDALKLPDVDFDWTDEDWESVGRQALDLVKEASSHWETRKPSAEVSVSEIQSRLDTGLPWHGQPTSRLMECLREDLLPLSTFNGHPRFFSYITSSPNPIGVIGDFVASAFNQNASLWRAAPLASAIELQTIDWLRQIIGMPEATEGIFSSGGQMANVIAHNVFRDQRAGWDVRRFGLGGPDGAAPRLAVYVSDQAHYCHEQAADVLGLGRDAVRSVPSDGQYRMRVDALLAMIEEDRAAGVQPLAIIATAGTVGTGAIDPIERLVKVARDTGIWLHVDGAYGAFAILAESGPTDLKFMRDADSVACDPHKWLCTPIDAAATLIRRPGALEASFLFRPPYLLQTDEEGQIDLVDRSPENTRPFRALKVWLALRAYGVAGYGRLIERNIELARYFEGLVEATPDLVLVAPRQLSITCWRVEPENAALSPQKLEDLQIAVIGALEREGAGFISQASLRDGRRALRACIVNFRTSPRDMEVLAAASARLGRELAAG